MKRTVHPASTRRDILKLMGLTSAVVIPSPGADPEVVTAPAADPPAAGSYPYGALVRRLPLYSKLFIPRNSMKQMYTLFVESVGMPSAEGGYVDLASTNMVLPSRLPPPECYAVERVGFIFSPTVERGLRAAFAERYFLEFQLENRIYFRAPIAALFDVSSSDDPAGFAVDAKAIRGALPITPRPVLIEGSSQFCVTVATSRPLSVHGKVAGWAYLEGVSLTACQ